MDSRRVPRASLLVAALAALVWFAGCGGGSSSSTSTTIPVAPTFLAATPGNGQVSLNWAGSLGAVTYSVERATTSGGPYTTVTTSPTTTSFIDTGLANNTTYFYVVTATNTAGTSPISNQASATPVFAANFTAVQHIVFIIREHHSFDNYFGAYPNAHGATSATLSNGTSFKLVQAPDKPAHDLCDTQTCVRASIDGGKMDQFDMQPNCSVNNDNLCLSQYQQSDIPNYWTLAQNFALSDAMFASLAGPSFPNHLYTVAGQAGNAIGDPSEPGIAFSFQNIWGCDAPLDTTVEIVGATLYPCFGGTNGPPEIATTLPDLLQAANPQITWKYYAPTQGQSGYLWSTLDAINHIRNGPLWASNVVPDTQFIIDAQSGNLPAVSWLVTSGEQSEHPAPAGSPPVSVCAGENWTVQQLSAIMQNTPEWNSTVIFLTWDDSGGFYDHVSPQVVDQFGLGLRVPLLIVSPYAKRALITHTQYEFGSFLKFVEERFALPNLGQRDSLAGTSDMLDSFDFTQAPLPALSLSQRTCP